MWLSFSFVAAIFVEILLPIVLGFILVRRRISTWKQIFIGCGMLLFTQSLLIPLLSLVSNWLVPEVGVLEQRRWMPIMDGLILGLLSGILVESIRWITLRFVPGIDKRNSGAIALGLGYAGIETIIFFGIPILISFINMLIYKNTEISDPSLSEGLTLQVQALWQLPWYTPLVSAFERATALVMHITLSLLVVHAFVRKQVKLFFFAVGWHSLYEAFPLILLEYQQPDWLIELFLVLVSATNLILWFKYFQMIPKHRQEAILGQLDNKIEGSDYE